MTSMRFSTPASSRIDDHWATPGTGACYDKMRANSQRSSPATVSVTATLAAHSPQNHSSR
jgi:hypothetical protein